MIGPGSRLRSPVGLYRAGRAGVVLMACAWLVACAPETASPVSTFDCGGVRVTVLFDGDSLTLTTGDERYVLDRARSASGARYEGPEASFWEHQGRAMVSLDGRTLPECTRVAG